MGPVFGPWNTLENPLKGLYILKWFLFAEEHFFIKTISYFENSN